MVTYSTEYSPGDSNFSFTISNIKLSLPVSEIDSIIGLLEGVKARLTKAHPHAEAMKLYAEDAAKTDKPWALWQAKKEGNILWIPLPSHPAWLIDTHYRRKP